MTDYGHPNNFMNAQISVKQVVLTVLFSSHA